MRLFERGAQVVVGDVGEAAPRRDARVPERLGLPEVADAGDETLVEQRVADLALRVPALKSREHAVVVGRVGEDVGAEPPRDATVELEDGAVEHRADVFVAAQHEPGLSEDRRVAAEDAPASLHAQVAAQHEPAFEAEQEVLADRLDVLEPAAVEPRRELLHGGARMRRLDLELLADEHLQSPSSAMKGVSFGHAGRVCRRALEPQSPER